jgi:putative transposase
LIPRPHIPTQVDFPQRPPALADKKGMSLPREVLPGRSYLITRRCTQRQFLMRPDKETNNAFVYCLAEAASRHGIEVLFTVAMSNHHHTGIHDPHGNYPAFLEHFHKLFAKCQNVLRGRWENFWAAEQTSVVRLASPEDVMEKLIYAITNPVKDHLVEKALEWPGINSYRAMLERRELCAKRPTHFFREDGGMPETATLRFNRPPGFEDLSHKAWAELLKNRVSEIEKKARLQRKTSGMKALGEAAILAQKCSAQPKTAEPRRVLSPRVAAKNKWRRIEALMRNQVFVLAYQAAFETFREGTRTIFPDGTYWLKRFANVCLQSDCSVVAHGMSAA